MLRHAAAARRGLLEFPVGTKSSTSCFHWFPVAVWRDPPGTRPGPLLAVPPRPESPPSPSPSGLVFGLHPERPHPPGALSLRGVPLSEGRGLEGALEDNLGLS